MSSLPLVNLNNNDTPESKVDKINRNFMSLWMSMSSNAKSIVTESEDIGSAISGVISDFQNRIENEALLREDSDQGLQDQIDNIQSPSIATTTDLGLVMVGAGLAIDANGVLSLDMQSLDGTGF